MMEILFGQFFWGLIVGLFLSFVGGYFLAKFTVAEWQKRNKKMVTQFCGDTIKNIQTTINELETTRDRATIIHIEFLFLIDIEIAVYGRNREHLIQLPQATRNDVRTFMNECSVKRAAVVGKLDLFTKARALADQWDTAGNASRAQRERSVADIHLREAHVAVDKLVRVASKADKILGDLAKL